jgi:endonuclease G, mitochondrial
MKRSIQEILKEDKVLAEELTSMLASGNNLSAAKRFGISSNDLFKAMTGPVAEMPNAEAMIRLHLRPALFVKNNKITMPDSKTIRTRLMPHLPKIENRLASVGRIDFKKLGRAYGGTGWMITNDIIVTNRHVAKLFAEKKGKGLVFRKNAIGETIEAFIDFKEEYMGQNVASTQFEIAVERVLYMAEDKPTQPDIAFLKIRKHDSLPQPIPLSDMGLIKNQFISVVGYPAYDPDGIISTSAAHKVFGGVYEVKRFSPGEVIEYTKDSWYFFHDCTTLGGNSGSVVLDNTTGVAVGLHFMGEVEKENYAVKGNEILKHLRKVDKKYIVSSKNIEAETKDLEINEAHTEAPADSYQDREGFDELFLGKKAKVSLPKLVKGTTDLVKFKVGSKQEDVLKYHHFSVAMNKKRRMCIYSACNIDGKLSKRGVKRTTWKTDPRIPKELQIIKECYGNPPKFSRGHMTRKEDPIWGSLELAREAAADTFHVTNATPQMQPFNAPVWLALEDYALENARQDDMKISVITGPIFKKNDPTKYDVQIPVEFFKIIAFIHDDTGKLCATGYTVSQEEYLSNEEFVFGQFNSYQVAIKTIERKTGLSFGTLSKFDPIKGEEAIASPLASRTDIRFV